MGILRLSLKTPNGVHESVFCVLGCVRCAGFISLSIQAEGQTVATDAN